MFSQAGSIASSVSNTTAVVPSLSAHTSSSLDLQNVSTAAGMKMGLAGQTGSSSHNPIQISSPSGLQGGQFIMATTSIGSVSTSLPNKMTVSSMSFQTQPQLGSLGQQSFSLTGTVSSIQSGGISSQAGPGVGGVSMPAVKSEGGSQVTLPYASNAMSMIGQQQGGGASAQVNSQFNKEQPFGQSIGSSQANAPMSRTTSTGGITVTGLGATNPQLTLAGTPGPGGGTGQKPGQANIEKAMIAAQMAVKIASGQGTSASAGVGAPVAQRPGSMQASQAPGVKVSNTGTGLQQSSVMGMGQPQNQQVTIM